MARTGLGKGLAVRHDFGADINRLYQQENLRSQIQVEKERKARYYGEMLKGGHVRGKANTERLQQFYDGVNDELATFVTENPGWETDPGLFAEFSRISDQYLNNDIIREDLQVQANFEALQRAAQSGSMDAMDIERNMEAYNEYIENGGDPYVFVNPKKVEYNDIVKESIGLVGYTKQPQTYRDAQGFTRTIMTDKPNEGAIARRVEIDFADEKYAREIEDKWQKAGGLEVAQTPEQWHENNLLAAAQFAISQAAYDQKELAAFRHDLTEQDEVPPSAALRRVAQPYWRAASQWQNAPFEERAAIEKAFNENAQPDVLGIKFTKFADNKPHSITPSDRVYTYKNGKPMYFQGNLNSVEVYSTDRPVLLNGQLYYEANAIVSLPSNPAGEDANDVKSAKKVLEQAGFTVGDKKGASLTIIGDRGSDEESHEGVFLIPAQVNKASWIAYDKAAYGNIEDSRKIRQSGQYDIAELTNYINTQIPGFGIGTMENGQVISSDGTLRLDPKTGELHRNE
jgi:hypothetical protein